jgi:hypothetical protein
VKLWIGQGREILKGDTHIVIADMGSDFRFDFLTTTIDALNSSGRTYSIDE